MADWLSALLAWIFTNWLALLALWLALRAHQHAEYVSGELSDLAQSHYDLELSVNELVDNNPNGEYEGDDENEG
jgi:hypothetical protein